MGRGRESPLALEAVDTSMHLAYQAGSESSDTDDLSNHLKRLCSAAMITSNPMDSTVIGKE